MWRLPSLTPSCWVRACLPARHSRPMEQSSSSRSCAACRDSPAQSRSGGRGGRAARPPCRSPPNWPVADRLKLVISPAGGRRADLAAELTGDGIAASDGPPPAGAIVVAAAADSSGDTHLAVLAGTREGSGDLDQWVQDLIEADSSGGVDVDGAAARGHRRPSLRQGARRG
jgi:hypothetical protein